MNVNHKGLAKEYISKYKFKAEMNSYNYDLLPTASHFGEIELTIFDFVHKL